MTDEDYYCWRIFFSIGGETQFSFQLNYKTFFPNFFDQYKPYLATGLVHPRKIEFI